MSLADLAGHVHYSKSYLSKVETGHKLPSLDLARRCDAALDADGALVALVPSASVSVPSLPVKSRDDQWTITVDGSGRGHFDLATRPEPALAGTASLVTWAMTPAAARRGDGGATELDPFRVVFDQLRRLGQSVPPAVLLPTLIGQTHALRVLATTARPPTHRAALLLASRHAELTGWVTQEAGDERGALWWTDHAVDLAATGGDRELAAYALVRHGLVAMYRHDAHETIAVAKRAQASRYGPRIRGLAALREAQGHALAGNYDLCRRALDRGAVLLEAASDDGQPVLGSTTTRDPVAMTTGWCLHDLGRSRQAIGILANELAAVPEHAHRTRARIGMRYALALVAAGELEEACAVVDQLLELVTLTDSATIRSELRRVARDLNRRHSHRAVREVMPRIVSVLRTPYR